MRTIVSRREKPTTVPQCGNLPLIRTSPAACAASLNRTRWPMRNLREATGAFFRAAFNSDLLILFVIVSAFGVVTGVISGRGFFGREDFDAHIRLAVVGPAKAVHR